MVMHRALFTWFILLVFFVLLCLRLESRTHWNWFIIFLPLWVYDAILLVYALFNIVIHCKHENVRTLEKNKNYLFVLIVLLKIATQIIICLKLEYTSLKLSVYHVLLPLWILLPVLVVDITMILIIFLLTTSIKLLLIPAYRSTDFEVHRNWLAITHNHPVAQWYYEAASEWTLDYPPLFAWFEWLLSQFAKLFDAQMLQLDNHYYASFKTVLFQRLTVIVTDIVFAYGTYKCCLSFGNSWRTRIVLPILLITNVGLLMVDHIHFQYNGIMYGMLLLSIAAVLKMNYMWGAFWFLILLNMKHLFLYMAPVYFVYFLRNFCFNFPPTSKFSPKKLIVKNLVYLGALVIFIFSITFLPFISHLNQVFIRLFPFKRGLCHAYWAPNVWAVYNVVDKAAVFIGNKLQWNINADVAIMTGGLVQEFSHTILPNITPLTTMILTVCGMLPALYWFWFVGPKPEYFIRCLVICSLTSFLFGWHVHEKAILMAIIPLSILSVIEPGDAKVYILLSTVGHYSLFPLLFPNSLTSVKVLLLIISSLYAFYSLSNMYPLQLHKFSLPLLNVFESTYLMGLVPLFLYENVFHHLLDVAGKLPYLPLMLTSVYCALGVTYCWMKYYIYFINKCKVITNQCYKKQKGN